MVAFAAIIFLKFSGIEASAANIPSSGKSAEDIGRGICEAYLGSPIDYYSMLSRGKHVTYQEVCTWLGALRFAEAVDDKSMLDKLAARYDELVSSRKEILPPMNHVDSNVFGSIPLELFIQHLRGKNVLEHGLVYADSQWNAPKDASEKALDFAKQGFSWETRLWVDDMFMITTLQCQAYRATGDKKYVDRAAYEMNMYLDSLQRENGLFYHHISAPFFWGRGNGWVAVGMTDLLSALPNDSKYFAPILGHYKRMMEALKKCQGRSGLWHQLLDNEEAWDETSSSAMFATAMIIGINRGWLDEAIYRPIVLKAWEGLISNIADDYKVENVCQGTNIGHSTDYYLKRERVTGDLHGQASVLWCATLLSQYAFSQR